MTDPTPDYCPPASRPEWQTPALNAALAKAQGEMGPAGKDRTNPHFQQKYATLASVIEACKPLAIYGIAHTQLVTTAGPVVSVTTILRHASGEILDCGTLTARARDESPQSLGSALTYLRRYGLMAAVGVGPADDDDGAAAMPAQAAPARGPELNPPVRNPEVARREAERSAAKPTRAPKETAEDKAMRQAEHDPSWDADKAGFFARLKSMSIDGPDLVRWCVSLDRPRPSQMPREQREAMIAALGTGAHRAKFNDFLAANTSNIQPERAE